MHRASRLCQPCCTRLRRLPSLFTIVCVIMVITGVAILCGDLHLDQFVALQHFVQLRDEGWGHTLAAGLQQGFQVS